MKLISVIVPVYNAEKSLNRCVDSILGQTYRELEIILVNDGSTDRSGEICDCYKKQDRRVRVIHKNNGGQSSARNAGLDIATGDYIGFVDSDDWIVDDIYEHCIEIIGDSDVVDFQCVHAYSHFVEIKLQADYEITAIEGKEIVRDYLLRGQTEQTPFSVCRKLYKSNLFNDVYFPDGKVNEDIVTNYEVLAKAKKLVRTNKIGYYYFQKPMSTTRGKLKKRDLDLLYACDELIALTMDEDYKDIKYLAEVKQARSYFSLLAKIAYYGIEEDEFNKRDLVKYLTNRLRQNYFFLMRSPIPLNRKLMATALSININCLAIPLSIYKHIRERVKR